MWCWELKRQDPTTPPKILTQWWKIHYASTIYTLHMYFILQLYYINLTGSVPSLIIPVGNFLFLLLAVKESFYFAAVSCVLVTAPLLKWVSNSQVVTFTEGCVVFSWT